MSIQYQCQRKLFVNNDSIENRKFWCLNRISAVNCSVQFSLTLALRDRCERWALCCTPSTIFRNHFKCLMRIIYIELRTNIDFYWAMPLVMHSQWVNTRTKSMSTYPIEWLQCVDSFCCSSMLCLFAIVDFGVAFHVLLHCSRLRRRNAFGAYVNRGCQCNRYHHRPLLANYWGRMNFFRVVRWFCAPIRSTDVPNAKCPIATRPNATAAVPNCFSMRTQAIHSFRLSF